MINEIERTIKLLQEKRNNLKKAKESLKDDEHKEYLEGVYAGQRIELFDEINYLKTLVATLKGEK